MQSGDLVRLRHSRPLSKTKRWVVDEILKRERQFDREAVNAAVKERVRTEKMERTREAEVSRRGGARTRTRRAKRCEEDFVIEYVDLNDSFVAFVAMR